MGRPQFQGANEYLTFQQILTFPRDYRWPENMEASARDLILKLLKQECAERIGMTSYDELKAHVFFATAVEEGRIVWGDMTSLEPPPQPQRRTLPEPAYDGANPQWLLEGMKAEMQASGDAAEAIPLSRKSSEEYFAARARQHEGSKASPPPPPPAARVPSQDSVAAGDWSAFCRDASERVVLAGLVGKKNRAWVTRKRYLLLIEGSVGLRFVYVSPDSLEVKGEVPYNPRISVELKNKKQWTLNTPGRTFLWSCLGDDGPEAALWVDTVFQALERYRQ